MPMRSIVLRVCDSRSGRVRALRVEEEGEVDVEVVAFLDARFGADGLLHREHVGPLPGKIEVRQVLGPTVTSTRTDPKPRRGTPSAMALISSASSSGTVTKCHDPSPEASQIHSGAVKR